MSLRILVGCEETGIVRDAFAALGWDAWSCDLKPSQRPGQHYQGDLLDIIGYGWDLFIVHPECRYICLSGLHWNLRRPERAKLTKEALEFVRCVWNAPIERVCMENPMGCIPTRLGLDYSQVIQPYNFGDNASKKTCLWLRGLPLLQNTDYYPPRIVEYKGKKVERWGNQTDSGQNNLGPSPDRSALRAATYPGIAKAMAKQWGQLT